MERGGGLSQSDLNILDKFLCDTGFGSCCCSFRLLMCVILEPAEAGTTKALFPLTSVGVTSTLEGDEQALHLAMPALCPHSAQPLSHGSAHRWEKPVSIWTTLEKGAVTDE